MLLWIATEIKGKELTTFINFGKPYPNQTFTVVIFKKHLKRFTGEPSETYLGKKICVTGKVRMYKGKPEQVVVVE